jgi:hypothetical protein
LTKLFKEITSCPFSHHLRDGKLVFTAQALERLLEHRNNKWVRSASLAIDIIAGEEDRGMTELPRSQNPIWLLREALVRVTGEILRQTKGAVSGRA